MAGEIMSAIPIDTASGRPMGEAPATRATAVDTGAPTIASYTDAPGTVSAHCGCRVTAFPRGVVVVVPCDAHAGVMIVEARPRVGHGSEGDRRHAWLR